MDNEKTIQFLLDNAAAHDARLAALEKAAVRVTEHQILLQTRLQETGEYVQETQKSLRELGEKTDGRITKLTGAIAALIEQKSNGKSIH